MRKIRGDLRLKWECGLSRRQYRRELSGGSTDCHGIPRLADTTLSWPLPTDLDEVALECLLFPAPLPATRAERLPCEWPRGPRRVATQRE